MDGAIKESELIQLDGTIDKLINNLTELNTAFGQTMDTMKSSADKLARSLKTVSGATAEGRKFIDEAQVSAFRYERAQYELAFALSETGRQVAWLKAQTKDINSATVDQRRQLEAAATSYDRLKADIKELTRLWKSLTAAERDDSEFGEEIIQELRQKNAELKKLNKEIQPHIEKLTRLQKAEQELAYWQSEEGKRLLEVKRRIREVTTARKEAKAAVDPLVAAQQKLAAAQSVENQTLKEIAYQTKQANTLAELQAKVATTQEGSYNRLAATYELTKFELKNLNTSTSEGAARMEEMQQQLREMYAEMRKFQEATGVYSLSVGDYANSWGGLGYSVQQVVRELPAATVSLNTFFLAISNNIPILIDEINRARLANRQMMKEGKDIVPVSKQIVKALFSWQSALVIGLTVFSAYGKEILSWVGSLFRGKNAILQLGEAVKNVSKEMENTNGNFGDNMLTIRKLSDEWKELKTDAEKTQWITDNEDAFKQLNIAIYDSADAERLLVENTEAVKRAFQDRARAAAAYKLTQDKYNELLLAEEKRMQAETTGPTSEDVGKATQLANVGRGPYDVAIAPSTEEINATFEARIQKMKDEEEEIQAQIDLYYELGKAAQKAGDNVLGIYEDTDGGGSSLEKRMRDLTDYINNMRLRSTEKYEKAITELERNEYEKRRKEAHKSYTTSIIELENMYDKNKRILADEDNLYKDLTAEQTATLMAAQTRIQTTLKLIKAEYDQLLTDISLQEKIGGTEVDITGVELQLDAVKKGSDEEYALREQLIEKERQLAIYKNKTLIPSERQDELDINAKYDKMLEDLEAEHQIAILETEQAGIEARLKTVKEGSQEELDYQLHLLEKQKQIALLRNSLLSPEQQVEPSVITAGFAKESLATVTSYDTSKYDDTQARDAAQFESTRRAEREITTFKLNQEKLRWLMLIDQAKSGALDWSKEQIEAAEYTVAGINREIKELNDPISIIGSKGLIGGGMDLLGFDTEGQTAMQDAISTTMSQLQEFFDLEVQMAEKEAEMAAQRVERAKTAYDAEVEARNNGYANNVASAKAELELEKKKQQDKQKLLAQAQKRQEAINSVVQASSLITASANLWSSLSPITPIGPALALAAIATMWSSFALAKVKAKQVTAQAYGEGGLEFLEGGSHASGNDIDLGVTNSNNKRMRAEGGEALAIINRKNTRRYKRILPDIVDSLNRGVFEEKYSNAFNNASDMLIVKEVSNISVDRIEREVEKIRKQGEVRYYPGPDGALIEVKGNVTRIIKS